MEDWDLVDLTKFLHLSMDTFMKCIVYKDMGVIALETEEWARGVEKFGLLNLLWVPHYHHAPINTTCIC